MPPKPKAVLKSIRPDKPLAKAKVKPKAKAKAKPKAQVKATRGASAAAHQFSLAKKAYKTKKKAFDKKKQADADVRFAKKIGGGINVDINMSPKIDSGPSAEELAMLDKNPSAGAIGANSDMAALLNADPEAAMGMAAANVGSQIISNVSPDLVDKGTKIATNIINKASSVVDKVGDLAEKGWDAVASLF